ncbi:VOC family protein, partial [Shewanella sp. 0m-11]
HQVGLAHFAYVTDDLDGVIERLKTSGHLVDKAGAEDPYRRNVYFIDPDGYEVEFVEYLTDIPAMRNQYE